VKEDHASGRFLKLPVAYFSGFWSPTEGGGMARKRYAAEEIIGHLRTIEIETGRGLGLPEACRKVGITEQTFTG
jgi:hypothetical protein